MIACAHTIHSQIAAPIFWFKIFFFLRTWKWVGPMVHTICRFCTLIHPVSYPTLCPRARPHRCAYRSAVAGVPLGSSIDGQCHEVHAHLPRLPHSLHVSIRPFAAVQNVLFGVWSITLTLLHAPRHPQRRHAPAEHWRRLPRVPHPSPHHLHHEPW